MAFVTLTLEHLRNVSVQRGDDLYFVPVTAVSNFNVDASEIIYLGPIVSILENQDIEDLPNNTNVNVGVHVLVVDVDPQLTTLPTGEVVSGLVLPTTEDFLMFSKNNKSNMSSIAGYYAELRFVNTSKHYAELFSIGAEISESSS